MSTRRGQGLAALLLGFLPGPPQALSYAGMMSLAVGMHWQGILGVPRRTHIANMSPRSRK